MARPDRRVYQSQPLYTYAGWDNYRDVDAVLRELEMGNFRRASVLADAFGRDDRITSVLETRVGALKAVQLDITPSRDRRIARKAAEMLGGVEDTPGEWERIISPGVLFDMIKWGTLTNFALAEILWTNVDRVWWPRLKFWHPQFVRWDESRKAYLVQTSMGGEIELPRVDENPTSDGHWVVWCPRGYQYAWLKGLVRGLALKYVTRAWNQRDFARWCEMHGIPMRVAVVPGSSADSDQANEFFAQVANMNGEPAVKAPQGAEGERYDVQYREAVGRSFDGFDIWKKHLDSDIAILLLGQELTTAVGDSGSRALGDIQNLVRIDKLKEDADFATVLRDQVLTHWARFNFDDPELAPRVKYQVEPPEDLAKKAAGQKAAGDAVTSLTTASKRVDGDMLLEEAGIPMLTPEEAEARAALAAEQAAALAPPTPPAGDNPPGSAPKDDGPPPKPGTKKLAATDANRRTFADLPLVIENARGTYREWTDLDGKTGRTLMHHDYGYIEGYLSGDGEELDVYVGQDTGAPDVHVIHQLKSPNFKGHDEDKTMLGFPDAATAKRAYLLHRNDGERAFGGMSTIPLERFKAKLKRRAPASTSKIRASAQAATTAALVRLAEKVVMLRAAPKRKKKPYADRLADRSIALAAEAMSPLLSGVQADIAGAETFDDLEKKLAATLSESDPKRLAELTARTRVLARLAGRASLRKEAE